MMCSTVVTSVMQLFTEYHQDAMLLSDIIALLKALGKADDSTAFSA